MDGSPLVSTESGEVRASSVVVQRVAISSGASIVDAAGNPSPVASTVGTGSAVVLRDGLVFDGTWSRPQASAPTRFLASDGSPLPLAEGQVWILLVPA